MRLSIVVPAHNEEMRISPMLDDYCSYFSKIYGKDFELFVVVNYTTDNTLGVVKKFAKRFRQVRFVDIPEHTGKGGAIAYGLSRARGDIIGYVDADGSTPASAFYDLVKILEDDKGVSGVIASRWRSGSIINRKQPVSRRIASRVFNLMVRVMFGLNYSDTQCGAKAFMAEALKKIISRLGVTKWAFDIDLLHNLKKSGFRVVEIPTTWNDREDSKLNVGKVSVEMFFAIIRYRLIYSPFSFIVLCYDWFFGGGVKMDYRRVKNG